MTKHIPGVYTPTPWLIKPMGDDELVYRCDVTIRTSDRTGEKWIRIAKVHNVENARFLVDAVNSYLPLLEAAQGALQTLKDEYPKETWGDYPAIDKLEKAIELATQREEN